MQGKAEELADECKRKGTKIKLIKNSQENQQSD